jgi:hypothetical protein
MLSEVRRRLSLIARKETDVSRWSVSENFRPNWDQRAPFAAAFCSESRSVCDLGCGNQALRHLLAPGIGYLPADLTRRSADTLLCELNKGELPVEYLSKADTVTLLGVIEYIFDVPQLVRTLRTFLGTLIVSYNPSDMNTIDRREKGWVNDYKFVDLCRMIVESGYVLRNVALVDPGQVILQMTAIR